MNPLSWILAFRWPLEIIALIAAVLPMLIILRAWDTLPEEIPMHFGITGRPDRWGGRWQAWILPFVSLAVYVFLSVMSGTWGWLMGRVSPSMQGEALALPLWIKLMEGLVFSYIVSMTVRIARHEAERLNGWVIGALIVLTGAPPGLMAILKGH
jgi:hypothetical protein